ncbi:DUF3613 domain-containing protein [Pseudomonas argentinensis]|uniref:Uncharacterized protein n=1 Tax=Phytopseudomonas argentinensis TaxID=289370 RepID=A0A1I3MGH3_9GAMM|nr:DUF3613 domain-containing protein [Pseudomonas argentinensis]KAB0546835.1 DUF3613 domain-containing protein [Pseudomonas argentinensis]SFI96204.1 Protein of unknown function [Pseudomonas argentinensis]
MKGVGIGVALLACLPLVGLADERGPKGLVGEQVETQTAHWLRLQREGRLASDHPQTSTPAERELALQRWLESHKHPIPEFYEQDVGGKLGEQ